MNEKDPREILAEMAETDLMLRAKVGLEQFTQYYENNQAQLRKEFCQPFQALFKKGSALQNQGKQGEIAFLVITVLRSLIMEHCYQLRLDLYNKDYLLDPVECSGYVNLDYLFKYIDTDIESFITGLKQCGAKFASYEVDRIKKSYIDTYAAIAQEYLVEQIPAILELKEFAALKKMPDFKILYGEYHDRTVTLYDASLGNERGEA
jgi:hypothetical protein